MSSPDRISVTCRTLQPTEYSSVTKSRKHSQETRRSAPVAVSFEREDNGHNGTPLKPTRLPCSIEHCVWSLLVSVVHPCSHFPVVASFLLALTRSALLQC